MRLESRMRMTAIAFKQLCLPVVGSDPRYEGQTRSQWPELHGFHPDSISANLKRLNQRELIAVHAQHKRLLSCNAQV